mmetsp:Transcript_10779/g.16389  ORF Transcript_10779/g.16389 Transcript_10779/m.16389 type:complete len:248 (+) Transcript_10779:25-768(+)
MTSNPNTNISISESPIRVREPLLDQVFVDGVRVVGFGSLMSPLSARGTFPSLQDFKTVRVHGYRRVFSVPGCIFFDHGIADLSSLKIAGLSVEKAEGCSFIAAAFTIADNTADTFLRRENTYDFELVPYEVIGEGEEEKTETGLMCVSSTDEKYISRWGQDVFDSLYRARGVHTIWGWGETSGILPCDVYLRHCYLSAQALSQLALNSFLDDTYLADRKTTIRSYLQQNETILQCEPPPSLIGRYSG